MFSKYYIGYLRESAKTAEKKIKKTKITHPKKNKKNKKEYSWPFNDCYITYTMGKTAPKVPTDVLSVEKQTANIGFKKPTVGTPNTYYVTNRNGPMGSRCVALLNWCRLSLAGKKDSGKRGFSVNPSARGGDTFCKLNLALTEEDSSALFAVCRAILDAWKQWKDPVKDSVWYQKEFGLTDGTKVHNATMGIVDPNTYDTFSLGENMMYSGPSKTFFNALYGDKTDDVWYLQCNTPKPPSSGEPAKVFPNPTLILYDESGKRMKTKNSNGKFVYPSSGVELYDHTAVSTLTESKFFKETTWLCRTIVQVDSLCWKKALDVVSNNEVLFPVFKVSVFGNAVLKKTIPVLAEGVIPIDKRESIFNSLLFEGLEALPSKKRKRVTASSGAFTPGGTKVDPDFEKESLSDSEIEGEGDE